MALLVLTMEFSIQRVITDLIHRKIIRKSQIRKETYVLPGGIIVDIGFVETEDSQSVVETPQKRAGGHAMALVAMPRHWWQL